MAEELQHLIERIQKEGVEQAEEQAARIVSEAQAQAEQTLKKAEEQAAQTLETAEREAQVFMERSRRSLEQAGRDLLLTVGRGIEKMLLEILSQAVAEAMSPETVVEMMMKAADGAAEFSVNEAERDKLMQLLSARFADRMKEGVELTADRDILRGFKVSVKDGSVYRDFTDEAVVTALAAFLRPQLVELINKAVAEAGTK